MHMVQDHLLQLVPGYAANNTAAAKEAGELVRVHVVIRSCCTSV
jgi:hypothetical protein